MSRRIDWVLPHGRVLERMALREVRRRVVQRWCPRCRAQRMGLSWVMKRCRVCGGELYRLYWQKG